MTQIRLFEKRDWEKVKEIYSLGILTGNATFETAIPDYDVFVAKFRRDLFWVLESNEDVIAFAGLQHVSLREVYAGVMEVTIYVHLDFQGKGIATQLINYLIQQSAQSGIWTLYAAIIKENIPSIKLHLSAGFREIGYREKIAKLDGKWRDTILFERRSLIVN